MATWPYYTLNQNGRLVDEQGYLAFAAIAPRFTSVDQAERWLEANDYRGSVRGQTEAA